MKHYWDAQVQSHDSLAPRFETQKGLLVVQVTSAGCWWGWLLVVFGALALVWTIAVAGLVLGGRRTDARALAGFIPDCLVLMRRLLAGPRVSRRRKLMLVGLIGYLALPFDLVPDFIPIAGQLDDVIVVALVMRAFIRGGGGELLR